MDKNNQQLVNRLKLGLLLKEMRERLGVSQRDAAAKIGYANATFTCNVEKGGTNVPIDKVLDFAETYAPKNEATDLALAIIRLIHIDAWVACSKIFGKAYSSNITNEQLTKSVDKWIEDALVDYNIKL